MIRAPKFVMLLVALWLCCIPAQGAQKWPPVLGKPFPDLELVDQDGNKVRLSSFAGSVIILEPVGMTCSGCQAFSGGNKVGGFGGVAPQGDLDSFESYFERFSKGRRLSDRGVVFIQLLLYNMSMGEPTPKDARDWADHFGFKTSERKYVLAGTKDLMGDASYNMIPGFQLIDRRFVLVSDSTGHHPRHDLYDHLIPKAGQLMSKAE